MRKLLLMMLVDRKQDRLRSARSCLHLPNPVLHCVAFLLSDSDRCCVVCSSVSCLTQSFDSALTRESRVWSFAVYHGALIDINYAGAKRLLATWRVLLGIWLPQIGAADEKGENKIRRVLRLRAEAALSLADMLQSMEADSEQRETVQLLRETGANIRALPKEHRIG